MKRRWRPLLACAAVLAIALTGCSGTSSEDSGSEVPEGALVVYSGRGETLVGDLLDQFTAETGIPLEVRYGSTAELAAQMLEEGDRSPADVFFSQDAGALQVLEDAQLLRELPAKTLKKVFPEYQSVAGKWVGTSGRARVLVYNKELVPEDEIPNQVADLTDPKWKGQVGVAPTNASFQSFVTGMRELIGEEETKAWLEAMLANDVQIYDNNTAIRDAVDSGQIKVGLANHYYWYEKAAEVGEEQLKVANHFMAAGDPGSLVNVAGSAILNSSESPDAQAFVDFLLSVPAQEYFANVTYEYPLVKGVAIAEGLPPLATIDGPEIDLGQLADLQGTQQLLSESGML